MAGLVCRVSFITCLIIVTQTTQPSDSLSIPSKFLQNFQTIKEGFWAKASQDGRMASHQSLFQTLKSSIRKSAMGNSQFLTSPRSKKLYSSSGNFGIERFITFMNNANNLMNSKSGNSRVDNFSTAFNELFLSNGFTANNVFYTLHANLWTVVDAVANVVRLMEARIKRKKDEKRAELEPDPLEELKETFADTNVNFADISNLINIFACDPNGGAEFSTNECLTDRDTNEFLEEERSTSDMKLQNKSGQSQLQVQPLIVPQIRTQPSQTQVRPPALGLVPPKVVPQHEAQSISSSILPTVLHTKIHAQPPQNPPQIPLQVLLQNRIFVAPQVRQPIQPQIQPQVRYQAIPQSEAGGTLRRFQVQPQFRSVNSQERGFLPV